MPIPVLSETERNLSVLSQKVISEGNLFFYETDNNFMANDGKQNADLKVKQEENRPLILSGPGLF